MMFSASKLRPGEIVAALGAALLLVSMFFFSWYDVSAPSAEKPSMRALRSDAGAVSWNGWHAHTVLRWLMLLTILAALALVVLTATQRTVAVPVTTAVIFTALAALLTVLLAYRVIADAPGPDRLIDVKAGAWLGLLSSVTMLCGGYLSMRDERTSLPAARERDRAANPPAAT